MHTRANFSVTLAQKSVEGKSNEIPAVQELIKTLEISGCIVVADAMNCQIESAKSILEANADYLLCAKSNQPTLKSDIEKGTSKNFSFLEVYLRFWLVSR